MHRLRREAPEPECDKMVRAGPRPQGSHYGTFYDQRFLLARYAVEDEVPNRTIVVQNWFTELGERVGR